MRIFALSTGRTGSLTFAHACNHAANYTVGHESRHGEVGGRRLDYDDNHIEVDNRLIWFFGPLAARYPDAFYVHLLRDKWETARSFSRRWYAPHGILAAWNTGVLCRDNQDMSACQDYVATVNENIRYFLQDKPHHTIRLERAADDFAVFWDMVGAVGDYAAAVAEWDVRYNEGA